jgi:hypothetical protein
MPAERRRPRLGLATRENWDHIGQMSKSPRVIFHPKRISEDNWQIEAHYAGAEIRYINGLTSKADVDDWMSGNRKVAWLRSQGYAK